LQNYLDIYDIEAAVLNGRIVRVFSDDPRGPRYTVWGDTSNGRILVGVVCRFTEIDAVLIITVYEVTEMESFITVQKLTGGKEVERGRPVSPSIG
jgi:hypothetical protein